MASLTSTAVSADLSSCKSHWDRLPVELVDKVFDLTNLLTKFLCGRLGPINKLDMKTARAVWHSAFESGWLGDYSLLPPVTGPNKKFTLNNDDLAHVKSRELYEHLDNFFPDMSESNPAYEVIDTNINKGLRFNDKFYVPKNVIDDSNKYTTRLLNIPMRNMWLDMLDDKIEHFSYAVARECIFRGHIDLLRHLLSNNIVKIEHLKCYKFINEKNEERYYVMMNNAAFNGHVNTLKLLHESGCTGVTTDAMNWAAENRHLPIVKWLHENRSEGCTKNAMDWAAENGHLDIVQYLHQHRNEGCTTKAMDKAAANGRIETVKWLHENRSEGCTTAAMGDAAENGRFDVVKWLHQHREEGCTTAAIDKAAENGHVKIVQFLLNNRVEGFTSSAFKECKSDEILDMLIDSMDHQKRIDMLGDLLKDDVKCVGRTALLESFM